jgi:c-di-GMP-binding flagellar brake protein YcgR
MLNYDDKRNFYRMLLNSEVIVTVIDDEANSDIFATCRDLSATGMAIEMDSPLAIDTNVRMRIDSLNSNVQPFNASGKVVRVVEEGPDLFVIGVTICEID